MKKLIFILMMLLVAGFAFSQAVQTQLPDQTPVTEDDAEIKAMLQKDQDYFQDFQDKFKTLKTYNATKQDRDNLKLMQAMIERQRKMIEFKMEEIRVFERGGKTVPLSEFSRLKELMDRYHQMTTDLNNWVNKTK